MSVPRNPKELAAAEGEMTRFEPTMSADRREALYARWKRAVERSRGWADET